MYTNSYIFSPLLQWLSIHVPDLMLGTCSAFVAHVARILAVLLLDHALEVVVDFLSFEK